MRFLKRTIIWTFLIGTILVLVGIILGAIYRDEAIQTIVKEANRHLEARVQVNDIKLNLFQDFPNVALTFDNLTINEPQDSTRTLATAQSLVLNFNLQDLWRGQYRITGAQLNNATIAMRQDKQGNTNFKIWKTAPTDSAQAAPVAFALQNVQLNNVSYSYTIETSQQTYAFTNANLTANLTAQQARYAIALKGSLDTKHLQVGQQQFLPNKALTINATMLLAQEAGDLFIEPSQLTIDGAPFEVDGLVAMQKNNLRLDIKGQKTTLQTLLSLLPQAWVRPLRNYQSNGNVFFNGRLSGSTKAGQRLAIQVDFGCQDATFIEPQTKTIFTGVNFTGRFTNGRQRNMQTASLRLSNIKAVLDNNPLQGSFLLQNLDDPYIDLNLKATAQTLALQPWLEKYKVFSLGGQLDIDLDFQGKTTHFSSLKSAQALKTNGSITFNNVSFSHEQLPHAVKNINGALLFNNNALALSGLKAQMGNSAVQFEGMMQNLLPWASTPNETLYIEAGLLADTLDLNPLLQAAGTEPASTPAQAAYSLKVSPHIDIEFDCTVGHLLFRNLHARNLNGKLLVKNQTIRAPDLRFDAAGGQLRLTSSINATNPAAMRYIADAELKDLQIDSMFYVLENFGQDFLTYEYLKGTLRSKVLASFTFDSALNIQMPTIQASASMLVQNGQLNNFEPVQQLSRFVNEEDLANMRFSNLSNTLRIANGRLVIPEMQIATNISTIQMQGVHNFDNSFDYRLKVPLRNYKKKDKDSKYGYIEEDGRGYTNLFLVISGTTSDFSVRYDSKSALKQFRSNIKDELKEFTSIFKKRENVVADTVALSQDEYFDWD